jgi:para-aminobenzoate synthetase/4-amino-4-deoxychorismate lyase
MDQIKPQSGFVKENEVLLRDYDQWFYFSNPHRIIVAGKLEDVLPALAEIEDLISARQWHAAGFLSYEAAPAFDSALRAQTDTHFPYLWFGLYSEPKAVSLPQPKAPKSILDWQPTIKREAFLSAVAEIKDAIAKGKTYQVNYTMQLGADFTGDAWNFFLHLTQDQNKHAAFLKTERHVVCSASPELFFRLNGNTIVCRPMKGTISRGRTTTEDIEQSHWLQNSDKNRAENVMIVDMIRNDLGKIADVGSVLVPRLFETERYSTLWQMTSTVTAKTKASLTEIFQALFPCGSITGAPKISTMKIIAELEKTPRKLYTGTIGFMSPNRKASFNVAIRTLLVDRQTDKAEYGIGGGIVWDSSSPDEYEEALLKSQALLKPDISFSLLETILWTPQNGFFLSKRHLARMIDSADYFGIAVTKEKLEGYLEQVSGEFFAPRRVRVLLDQTGKLSHDSKAFEPAESHHDLRASFAKVPIDSRNVFLFHKTTRREFYELARRGFETLDDVLLYNERGELTEFTIGNLVVELDGKLLTPPVACGVLAGTFRAYLLETGQVSESIIMPDQISRCTKIFRVNSIRKWERVELQTALAI